MSYDPKTAPRDNWTLIYDSAQRNPSHYIINGEQTIRLIDELRSTQALLHEVSTEAEKLKGRREHTQQWYASHYGKLEDWARTRLPDPWRDEFFSCIANGTWGHKDVGEPYMCVAGFEVVPSGYIRMDDAKGQLILDQTRRAEDAEAEVSRLKEERK